MQDVRADAGEILKGSVKSGFSRSTTRVMTDVIYGTGTGGALAAAPEFDGTVPWLKRYA